MIETNFKHTDIGPIPHDWEVKRTVDLFDINAAGDLMRDNYSEVKTSCHIYPIYSNSNIDKGLYGYTSSPRYRKNSFTITGRGNLGIAEYRNTDFDAIIRLLVLSPKKGASSLFYSYYTNFAHPYEGSATSIPQLPIPNVAKGLIPVPPVGEQEAIGNALSDIDELIGGLRKLIEKKRNIKKGAMSRLLSGSLRLPGFNKPWETNLFGDLGIFIKGKGISRDESNSGSIPAIRYGEIYTDHSDYIKKFRSHISQKVAETSQSLKYGDICFAASGETLYDIGKAVAFVDDFEAYAGGDIVIFRPQKEINPIFFGFLLNTPSVVLQKSLKGHGLSIMHIRAASLAELIINYPTDLAEQSAIAKVLTDMDAEIEGLEKKLAKYEQVKQGMMKQLLTGKIRLI